MIRDSQRKLREDNSLKCSSGDVEEVFLMHLDDTITLSELYRQPKFNITKPAICQQVRLSEPALYKHEAKLQNIRVAIYVELRRIMMERFERTFTEQTVFDILNIKSKTVLWTRTINP